jgi:hypothetical protein
MLLAAVCLGVTILCGVAVLADWLWWRDGRSFLLGLSGVGWLGLACLMFAWHWDDRGRRWRRAAGWVIGTVGLMLIAAVLIVVRGITG